MKRARFTRIRAAVLLAAVVASITVPATGAGADGPPEFASQVAIVTESVARGNADALTAESSLSVDNIACTIGAWGAVNQPGRNTPLAYVYGRDVATADAVCTQPDLLARQPSYTAFLDIELQYYDPWARSFETYRVGTGHHGICLWSGCDCDVHRDP